jgi:hypothetical protein
MATVQAPRDLAIKYLSQSLGAEFTNCLEQNHRVVFCNHHRTNSDSCFLFSLLALGPHFLDASRGQRRVNRQLTVNGQKFSESAVINWNGTPLQTTYVASTVLTAVVPASDLANSGSSSITVTNPLPGGGTSKPIQFAISPLVPLLSFSSATLSFPAESVGTASPVQTVAVENPGTAPLSISKIVITGADAGSFHETNNCGKSVAPGANCLISITFKPTSTGSLTAFVSVTDNATGSPQSVSLVGTGK